MKILISACLLGIKCRYDGQSKYSESIKSLTSEHIFIPICPEQLGGLPTPRAASERIGDKVISNTGTDVTVPFQLGAEATLEIARLTAPDLVILKNGSPSCGVTRIYDGSFSSMSISGMGMAAELLVQNGFKVCSEESFKIEDYLE